MGHKAGTSRTTVRRRVAGAIALLAGAVTVGAIFTLWIDAFPGEILFGSARVGGSASGIDTTLGRVTLAAGVLTIVGGGLLFFLHSGRLSGLLVLLSGATIVLCAALVIADPEAAFVNAAVNSVPSSVVPAELVESTIEQQLSQERVDVQLEAGLYVTLAGGAVGVIAGALGIIWGWRRPGVGSSRSKGTEPDASGAGIQLHASE